jgi:hypothetical protein
VTTLSLPSDHVAFTRLACKIDGSRADSVVRARLDPISTAEMERRWQRLLLLRRALIAAVGNEDDCHLLMRLTDGSKSCREIAEELGVCHTTLWRWVLRLRSRLRQHPSLRATVELLA